MNKSMRRLFSLICISALLAACLAAPGWAEEAAPLDGSGESAAEGEANPPVGDGVSRVSVQSFTADTHLMGMINTLGGTFWTGMWDISSAKLILEYSTSQLLETEISELTVKLNGASVYSGSITASKGEVCRLEIELPAIDIKIDDANTVSVDFYIRSGGDEVCEDLLSGANWINVLNESRVEIEYTRVAVIDSIAELYKQLLRIDTLEAESSVLAVSGMSEGALTGLASAAAGIAASTETLYTERNGMLALSDADFAPYEFAVYFSALNDLLPSVRALLSSEQLAAAQQSAVAALVKLGGTQMLVITGARDNGLKLAGRMLANDTYMRQLTTVTKAIDEKEDYLTEEPDITLYRKLTEVGTYVTGANRQSADYYVKWPANRVLTVNSCISLDLRYSDGLDYDRSLVSVYVNDVPIGSRQLNETGMNGCTVEFTLPDDLVVYGGFTVTVAFDLDVGDDWCRLARDEMPWGYVAPTSMLRLASREMDILSFDAYPAPFLRDGSYNELVVSLPAAVTNADVAAMYDIMATLGRFAYGNRGNLTVTTDAGSMNLDDSNVISVGVASANLFMRAVRYSAYFTYSEDGGQLLSNDKVKIDPAYGAVAGAAQLLLNPFGANDEALLIVTGANDAAMARAARFLGDSDELWRVSGNAFIADDEKSPYCYTFEGAAEEIKPDDVAVTVEQKRDVFATLLFGGIAVALCIAASLLLVGKYVRKRGGTR